MAARIHIFINSANKKMMDWPWLLYHQLIFFSLFVKPDMLRSSSIISEGGSGRVPCAEGGNRKKSHHMGLKEKETDGRISFCAENENSDCWRMKIDQMQQSAFTHLLMGIFLLMNAQPTTTPSYFLSRAPLYQFPGVRNRL